MDGRLVPASEARVSLLDPTFLHGDGCFETIRVHRGAPFRRAAHIGRLRGGLRILGIEQPPALDDAEEGLRKIVEASDLREGLVRVMVTAANPEAPHAGSVMITVRPLPSLPRTVVLHIVESVRRTPGPLSRCKTISRVVESVALREAQARGAFDGILLNDRGRVVETTARNLFATTDGVLVTPPPSEGALEGITRAAVLELASRSGIRAEERPLPMSSLRGASEVFLTGSGVGVLGVARIGSRRLAPAPGPSAAVLAEAYRQLLDAEAHW